MNDTSVTNTAVLNPDVQIPVDQVATIDVLTSTILLSELDYALAELLDLHTRGGYIKKSEVMDLLLDFRQTIENFPQPGDI